MASVNITIVTDKRFLYRVEGDMYIDNVILEDQLLINEFESKGLSVNRTNWDNPVYDWSSTKVVLIRATWDYHYNIQKFLNWLEDIQDKTLVVNSVDIIKWNLDKKYLLDLQERGIEIVPTHIAQKEELLSDLVAKYNWSEVVIKPAISAGGKDTYRIEEINANDALFQKLCIKQTMIVQPFIKSIVEAGEITLVILDGKYSHAIKKIAKKGEFRVQDDFGGTVHDYTPSNDEIQLAEHVFSKIEDSYLNSCQIFVIFLRQPQYTNY